MEKNVTIQETSSLKRALKLLFILVIVFILVEDFTTYLCLAIRKDVVEVGISVFFITALGLETGLLISFLIPSIVSFLCYYFALRFLSEKEGHPVSRDIFITLFVALAGLCSGLFAAILNNTAGLLLGIAPLGGLDPVSRYLFLVAIVAIGTALAIIEERKLSLD